MSIDSSSIPSLAAVVLAAGQGTRMKSEHPKVLNPVAGLPMVHHVLSLAQHVGAKPVVLVVGHGAEMVCRYVDEAFGAGSIGCALQAEQRGTAHAVECTRDLLASVLQTDPELRVLILYGDVPNLTQETVSNLLEQSALQGAKVGVLTFYNPEPFGYGRIVRRHSDGAVMRIVEEKDCTREEADLCEVNSGTLVVEAQFLFQLLQEVTDHNAKGEFYLTDIVSEAVKRGYGVAGVLAEDSAEVMGVNDRLDLAQADRARRERINCHWMEAGVSFEDPDNTYIDETVVLDRDVVLGPSVQLKGTTRIHSHVRVGMGCVLTDTVVEQGAQLEPYCVVEKAEIGPETRVGPFARLREGTVLLGNNRIGNFVETKKTVMGVGSKASHLTYLGDSTIGERVNIGAGTITCNYDGFAKNKTVLGDGVFVGSDTQLVAPVTVGDRAYIAAGTTVVKDVPEGCLAIARTTQVNREGYADKVEKRRQELREKRIKS